MTELKTVPANWQCILDETAVSRAISRISYEILEKEKSSSKLAIVGIRTAGEHIAKRIHAKIEELEKTKIWYGVIDITLYRDDFAQQGNAQPLIKSTELNFPVSGARIVLVDDVLYTGRTVRAALDAVIDFGRPKRVELAALVDRGHRELPIRGDYIGKNIPSAREDSVKVKLSEMGYKDGVYFIKG